MSRFDQALDWDGEGIPQPLWERVVSNALGGRRGQAALAEMEAALMALPNTRLIEGQLADGGDVCAIGAFVAHHRAQATGVAIHAVIEEMAEAIPCWCSHRRNEHLEDTACTGKWGRDRTCACTRYRPESDLIEDTVEEGVRFGLAFTVAWHFAYLNDEHFSALTPEQRFRRMLTWVRRAQGRAFEEAT